MSMTESYITILDSSLDKKLEVLDGIIALNCEQKGIIEADRLDEEAFHANVQAKAELIDKLTELDNGFQILYNNVKREMDNNRDRYSSQIAGLQKKISLIMEKSTQIQAEENRNKDRIKAAFSTLRKEAKAVKKNRQQVANYYKTMNKLTDEPLFMDKKK